MEDHRTHQYVERWFAEHNFRIIREGEIRHDLHIQPDSNLFAVIARGRELQAVLRALKEIDQRVKTVLLLEANTGADWFKDVVDGNTKLKVQFRRGVYTIYGNRWSVMFVEAILPSTSHPTEVPPAPEFTLSHEYAPAFNSSTDGFAGLSDSSGSASASGDSWDDDPSANLTSPTKLP